jgi:hypothetical protein
MTSEKQIEANRRNALKSTGPRTPQGKAVVRLNSLKNGFRARTSTLPIDDPGEFEQLCADLETELHPVSRQEQIQVEEIATSYWKLKRLDEFEQDLLMLQRITSKERMALLVQSTKMAAQLRRAYAAAQHELERLQRIRLAKADADAPVESACPDQAAPVAPTMDAGTAENSHQTQSTSTNQKENGFVCSN